MEMCRKLLDQAMNDVLTESDGDRDEALRSLVFENVLLRLSIAQLKGETPVEPSVDEVTQSWMM